MFRHIDKFLEEFSPWSYLAFLMVSIGCILLARTGVIPWPAGMALNIALFGFAIHGILAGRDRH
ncbi:TPA: hypothetical protein QDE50_21945 [Burkholderia cenocepacia]|uniref:hypothetical protein n=1 Tax=Burkholderia orbicola TaxID=2978683 RepID=UPI0029898E6F|nr:hypothetical protein [Burkholderia cenocepacia]HDR9886792.1 hypothetical protein [Burkholderia cenocepacia]